MKFIRGAFPTFFRPAAALFGCALALALLPGGADAQAIYRWVDERGVVNYGNTDVPKDREVKAVDTTPKVAVRAESPPAVAAARPSDTESLRRELARAREEVSRLRQDATAANSGARPGPSYAEWREECERQRRVDCDDPAAYAAAGSVAGVLRQPVILRRPHLAPKPIPVAPRKEVRVLESGKPARAALKPLASLQ